MQFAFDIAIHEPGIVTYYPTFLILRQFSGEVFRAIERFELTSFKAPRLQPAITHRHIRRAKAPESVIRYRHAHWFNLKAASKRTDIDSVNRRLLCAEGYQIAPTL